MEPMETDEGAIGISVADNPERKPATVTERPVDDSPAGAAGAGAASGKSDELNVDEAPSDPRNSQAGASSRASS